MLADDSRLVAGPGTPRHRPLPHRDASDAAPSTGPCDRAETKGKRQSRMGSRAARRGEMAEQPRAKSVARARSDAAHIVVVGGGLAGCEAAWQAARRGVVAKRGR